jgi:TRAP-type C4-dicarboxylate transport system permease small subunit
LADTVINKINVRTSDYLANKETARLSFNIFSFLALSLVLSSSSEVSVSTFEDVGTPNIASSCASLIVFSFSDYAI